MIEQKNNLSLNIVELWVPNGTDEREVQSACRKHLRQGRSVCIFRSGTGDCAQLTQELIRINLK